MVRQSKFFCFLVAADSLSIGGCTGQQSTLDPAGYQALQIVQLWWWMLGGALAVWSIMIMLCYYAIFARRRTHFRLMTAWVVIGGGVIFPTLLLTILLCFGLSLLPPLLARPPDGSLVIEVEGIQWWWRVKYPTTQVDGQTLASFETANEICIPVGQPVEFRLHSPDVIHAFWIPALGGKVDTAPVDLRRRIEIPIRATVVGK